MLPSKLEAQLYFKAIITNTGHILGNFVSSCKAFFSF